MKQYTIYCTEEQTKKALKLGAPILAFKNAFGSKEIPYFTVRENNEWTLYVCPTAEEIIGWLEGQGLGIDICRDNNGYEWSVWVRKDFPFFVGNDCFIDTRTEATLAAIDAALDYLIKHKGE